MNAAEFALLAGIYVVVATLLFVVYWPLALAWALAWTAIAIWTL